jgi:hypothetical protein
MPVHGGGFVPVLSIAAELRGTLMVGVAKPARMAVAGRHSGGRPSDKKDARDWVRTPDGASSALGGRNACSWVRSGTSRLLRGMETGSTRSISDPDRRRAAQGSPFAAPFRYFELLWASPIFNRVQVHPLAVERISHLPLSQSSETSRSVLAPRVVQSP